MTQLTHKHPTLQVALIAFFFFAFAFSWTFWIAAAVFCAREGGLANKTLLDTGILGPFVAACLLLYLGGSPPERQDFWRRIYEVERLRPRWLAIVLLVYPTLTILAVGLDCLAGSPLPNSEKLTGLLRDPMSLLASMGFVLLLGPLPEEPGWRGYALDRLQMLYGTLTASVWLGILWALWHLPLFFIPGTYQHEIGIGTLAFWLFNLTAISSSVLITWVYQHNERSIFAAILFHASLNFTRDTITLSDSTELVRTGLLTLLALIIALRCKPKKLMDCR